MLNLIITLTKKLFNVIVRLIPDLLNEVSINPYSKSDGCIPTTPRLSVISKFASTSLSKVGWYSIISLSK